jgi:putative transposase
VRTILAQPDAESVKAQHARTVEQLQPRFAAAAKMLAEAEEILAFTAFPKEHWRQIWSNNPQERLNREIPCAAALRSSPRWSLLRSA